MKLGNDARYSCCYGNFFLKNSKKRGWERFYDILDLKTFKTFFFFNLIIYIIRFNFEKLMEIEKY